MKNLWTNLLAAVLIAGPATVLVGCASPTYSCANDLLTTEHVKEKKSAEVALVMAPTTSFVNFPKLLTEATPTIKAGLGKGAGRFTVVLADGRPGVAISTDVKAAGQAEQDIDKAQNQAIQSADDVYSCAVDPRDMSVTDTVKTQPELDLFSSLREAADSFDAGSPTSSKRIVVLSNGLQTAGEYNMKTEGIPSMGKVSGIVQQLKSSGALPDLHGATVDFIGLGHVNSSSPELNQQSIDSLVYFWTSVIKASNGVVGTVQREVGDSTPSQHSITVSNVASQPDACVNVVVTEDEGVEFLPGTSVFKDPSSAAVEAKSIAAQVKEKPQCTGPITVTGYVASAVSKSQYVEGNSSDARLSLERANAFRQLLQGQGLTVAVNAIGGGKGPYLDWDSSGAYNEKLGQKNRIVIVSQDSK